MRSDCTYNQVMLTWDEPKRQINLRKHGIDFAGCDAVFDYPVVTWEDDREEHGEQRINLLGWLGGRLVHLTYVERGDEFRAISLREAEKHEIKRYRAAIANNR